MKNILKSMALLTLAASIVSIYATEQAVTAVQDTVTMIVGDATDITPQDIIKLNQSMDDYYKSLTDQERAVFDSECVAVEQQINNMTREERIQFYEQIIAGKLKDTDNEKPNTIAAYAEAGLCGLGVTPVIGLAMASGILLTHGSVIPGTLMLAGFAACITLPDIIADKLFSKATRQRAYEIRKAWVTLEGNESELKQKIFDSVFFLGCLSAPIIAAAYLNKLS